MADRPRRRTCADGGSCMLHKVYSLQLLLLLFVLFCFFTLVVWFYPSYGLNNSVYVCFSAVCNRTIQRERKCAMKCNLSAIFAFFLFFPLRVRNFNLVTVLAFLRFEIQPFSDSIIFFVVVVTIIINICFFFTLVAWFYPSCGLSN